LAVQAHHVRDRLHDDAGPVPVNEVAGAFDDEMAGAGRARGEVVLELARDPDPAGVQLGRPRLGSLPAAGGEDDEGDVERAGEPGERLRSLLSDQRLLVARDVPGGTAGDVRDLAANPQGQSFGGVEDPGHGLATPRLFRLQTLLFQLVQVALPELPRSVRPVVFMGGLLEH
jgi:hypothetical protein